MAVKVSNKLNNAFEGALAGGGDPATSPLYVFGPFPEINCRCRSGQSHFWRFSLAGDHNHHGGFCHVPPGDALGY